MAPGEINGGEEITALDVLISISRTRELTASESLRLERALRGGERKGQRWWTRYDDRRLLNLLRSGKKPAQICLLIDRTERAVWRRIYKKGWTVRGAEKGSIAITARIVGR